MLLQATGIMNEVSEGVETNISQSQINSLIKYQLSKNADWSIQSVWLQQELPQGNIVIRRRIHYM